MPLLRLPVVPLLFLAALPLKAEEFHLALYGQRDTITVQTGGQEIDTRVGRFGVILTGVFNPHVDASLDLAQVYLSQTHNPATQGMGLAGQFGGVALRVWPLRSHHLDVWIRGDYSAQYVTGSTSGQTTTIDWYDSGIAAGLVAHFGIVDLHGGARRGSLSGDEIASGTLTHTHSVHLSNTDSSWIGMDLYVDGSGSIGVVMERGGRESLAVRFARRF